MKIRVVGDRSLLLELEELLAVHRWLASLRLDPAPYLEEAVAGATTVLIVTKPGTDLRVAEDELRARPLGEGLTPTGREVVIPVQYGGADLEEVAALAGLDAADVPRLHSAPEYTVSFVGFSPGFAYLVGGDPRVGVARLPVPRTSVPAGAVALAAGMTAVYPQSTPGGWRVIGRTDAAMFDPYRAEPSLLAPGDRVRFQPVDRVGPAPVWVAPGPATSGISNRYVKVLDPGPLTTVQDRGRTGWAHVGVSRAGAADRSSAVFANQLVGNPSAAAVLEATLAGPRLLLGAPGLVAVTGARANVTVDGIPARQDVALDLRAGCELAIGPFDAGARLYIALSGGLDIPPVLGSRSTDTLSGIGIAPLRTDDVLPVGASQIGRPPPLPRTYRVALPRPGELVTVRAQRGPRDDWIGPRGMATLGATEFVVAPASDRTGVRLDGPPVDVQRQDELPSEGMTAGAVQVPPGGHPIVLLRNHPTTGGYPVAAVVDDEGVDLLAQARPGVRVRLALA